MPPDELNENDEEAVGDTPPTPALPSRLAVYVHRVIECLEDRRAVTAKVRIAVTSMGKRGQLTQISVLPPFPDVER